MIQIIKKMAAEAALSGEPVQYYEALVVSAPPNLQIKLKDNAKLVIPKDLITVSEHLTKHTRRVKVDGGGTQTHEFIDELKKGDKVRVASMQGGQSFFILDRFKSY